MRRNLAEILFPENERVGYERGDDLAQRAAAALADRFDAPTIIALTDALAFVDRVGGQLYVTTVRRKVDRTGNLVDDQAEGEFRSFGLTINYESRDAKVERAREPTVALGIPVTDAGEPAAQVALPALGAETGPAIEEAEADATAEEELEPSFEEPEPGEPRAPEPVTAE